MASASIGNFARCLDHIMVVARGNIDLLISQDKQRQSFGRRLLRKFQSQPRLILLRLAVQVIMDLQNQIGAFLDGGRNARSRCGRQ